MKSNFMSNSKIMGTSAALANKLALKTASDGSRILPAYLSDNYVSLLPGETRAIEVEYPAAQGPARLDIRGWNLSSTTVPIRFAEALL
jgi:hypothetical protein